MLFGVSGLLLFIIKGWTIDENTLSRPIVLGVGGAMYTDTRTIAYYTLDWNSPTWKK